MLKAFSFLFRWMGLLCLPGGVLWALSPTGVYLSELRFHTPNVFWKLFPSAPLLLLLGLIGLHALISGRSGRLERAGFYATLLGFLLILAGDVGEFWLRIDDVYIMTAPAYRAFRLGLIVMAAGAILFGVAVGSGTWAHSGRCSGSCSALDGCGSASPCWSKASRVFGVGEGSRRRALPRIGRPTVRARRRATRPRGRRG